MNCCCPHSRSANGFFSRQARRHRKRFEKSGFEGSQRQLMEGLAQAGYADASVLEIGSGVGHVHQSLLEQGAGTALGIDIAEKMIEEAEHWAKERSLAERTRYLQGDFMELDGELDPADVTVLDKVVCCYPDANGLVRRSLAKTKRVYALTYPRDRWYTRAAIGLMAVIMKLIRSDFRPYVHSPSAIEGWISEAGFRKDYQNTNLFWLTQVYVNATA
jgi:ubiquinone/menaquinone biosynthesis C-methylase UbiE